MRRFLFALAPLLLVGACATASPPGEAAGVPAEGLSVAIGSHEVSATHPELGVRRMPVDVKHGGLTEVTLRFE